MTRICLVVGLLVLLFAAMPRSWATDVPLTLQPDGDARFFEYFSDAFAQLDRGFNNNPALDGYYLISIWESSGGTTYQQVGSGADVFVVQNPCPGTGCTESNWVDLGVLSYAGSGDGTFPVTGFDIEFEDVITGRQLILDRPYTSTVNSSSGTVTVSGGVITGIDLDVDVTFNLDGQNFGLGIIQYDGTFTIDNSRFELFVDDTFNSGSLPQPYRVVWDVNGDVVPGLPPQIDPGRLALSASSYSIDENGGSLTVTVNRTGGSDGAASVSYATANGTATAPADYSARSGTLNWSDGDSAARTFTVPIVNDSTFEGDETFSVTLSSATGAVLGSPSSATVTIVEDDVAQTGTLALSSASYSIDENGGNLTVTVNRTGGSDGAASVSYATANGTATAPSDYTPQSGSLNWSDGDSAAKSFTVPIVNDSTFEGDETFSVTLSNAAGAGLGSPISATVTIVEDDPAQTGTLALSASSYSIDEDGGSLTVTVNRTGGSDGAASVRYVTVSGTATAPADYAARSGTLFWSDGDSAVRTFSVPIIDDSAFEGDEVFSVQLNTATGASLGSPSTATVTIVDDDPAPAGDVRFRSINQQVEEATGLATVEVERVNGSNGAVSVNYATFDGTATAPDDYQSVSGTLSWADGQQGVRSFDVLIELDTISEGIEFFEVRLSGATGGVTIDEPSITLIEILDQEIFVDGFESAPN